MPNSSNKPQTKIRVLLADDHHIVRAGVRQLIESASDLEVIAEAGDGEEATGTDPTIQAGCRCAGYPNAKSQWN